jgi:glycosyltransferase involved in cell wall biosynthesis
MRVCVIGLRGIPNVIGGIETHCENLYPQLCKLDEGLEVIVVARSGYAQSGEFNGVRIRPVWAPKGKGVETFVHTPLALLYARLRLHPEVVHLHGVGPGLFAPLARLLGFRTVVTHHAADYERPKWGPAGRTILRAGERLLAAFADQIICVNDGLAQRLGERYPWTAGRARTIRNGAPPRPSAAAADASVFERFSLTRGQYILGVGRLEPTKCFHDLIAAYKHARPAGKKLVIAGATLGDDAYARALLAQASDQIVFTGFQNAATLRLLYENAALFVLPSSMEGSPLAALEAMAADAPILLSDASANVEFRLDPHQYFPVGDVAALSAILSRGTYDEFRSAHSARILRESSWDEIACQHLIVLRSAAVPGRKKPLVSSGASRRDGAGRRASIQHTGDHAPVTLEDSARLIRRPALKRASPIMHTLLPRRQKP